MRTVIGTVLLALLIVCAGCASPENTGNGDEPTVDRTTTPMDNDAGAEPVNPAPNETTTADNGTGTDGAEATTTTVETETTDANESDGADRRIGQAA